MNANPASSAANSAVTAPRSEQISSSKATLIVAPSYLVGQWISKLKTRSSKPLKILSYVESQRHHKVDKNGFDYYDVVVTSYGVLVSEWTRVQRERTLKIIQTPWLYEGDNSMAYKSPLHRVKWHRLILDECHNIRNLSNATTASALALLSQRRWMMSGTPLTGSLLDLKYIAQFLGIQGWNDTFWKSLEQSLIRNETSPEASMEQESVLKTRLIQTLLAFCKNNVIRHTRDQPFNGRTQLLDLPAKTSRLIPFDLNPEQRHIYDLMFTHALARYRRFKNEGVAVSRCIECVQMLLKSRQAMSFARLVEEEIKIQIEEEKKRDDTRSTEHLARQSLQDEKWEVSKLPLAPTPAFQTLDSDCSICLDRLDNPVQTACGHLFCAICIQTYLDTIRSKDCPLCRKYIQAASLFRPKDKKEDLSPPPSVTKQDEEEE